MRGAETIKKRNIKKFDNDVKSSGSYNYTQSIKMSAKISNARISSEIAMAINFKEMRVLDLGCGDGAYTVEYALCGALSVLGLDPAKRAVQAAISRSRAMGLAERVKFKVGDIYHLNTISLNESFDVIVLRGVLHHLEDPELAIKTLSDFNGYIILLEPNGLNPILKILEKVSRYHIEHEEQSFSPKTICNWLKKYDFSIYRKKLLNCVPMFCPDWIAYCAYFFGPVVERLPVIRELGCGQVIIVAHR